jgi:putative membrane protein insertion efficiency factor
MSTRSGLRQAPARVAIFLVELYRTYVSPMRMPTCRFMPTCSQYAVEAVSEFGLIKGLWLSAVRLAKCGPWHRGGWDPIPSRHSEVHRPQAVDEVWESPAQRGESKSCV